MGAEQGRNKARARWRRAGIMTRRLQDGDPMLETAGVVAPNATRKPLETQHWLELIDGKHRYGSNR
ncbi:hypothetical protein DENSPDRAFT_834113 [Dentipellis sp. KUC8613]|nr:hypothetical protein DENSPDRAFT_834113 [Dentipellis sp. KUC8613]